MSHIEFCNLLDELKRGNNGCLNSIFRENASYCIKGLLKKHNCSREDAEDIYTDAVLNFRSKLLERKIEYLTDVRSYLFATCNNMFLAKLKREERVLRAASEIHQLNGGSPEPRPGEDDDREMMLKMTEEGLQALQGKCQELLKSFYFLKLSLEEIAAKFNMANSNVAKVSKARCFRKLVTQVKIIQQQKSFAYNASK